MGPPPPPPPPLSLTPPPLILIILWSTTTLILNSTLFSRERLRLNPINLFAIILYLPLPCICTILPIFCTGSNLQLPFLANKDYHITLLRKKKYQISLWGKKKKKKKKK